MTYHIIITECKWKSTRTASLCSSSSAFQSVLILSSELPNLVPEVQDTLTWCLSHTPSLCPSPGHVHPLSPAMGAGPCRQRRALDVRAALLEAADGPELLCPPSVPRETAGSTQQHHLTKHLPGKWLCFHDVLRNNEYKLALAESC